MRIITFLFFLCTITGYAQTKLEGLVVDISKNPISFVSVQLVEKDTDLTISFTQSDEKGVFTLNVKDSDKKYYLKLRLLGYKAKDIYLKNFKKINVTLIESVEQLNEVVIKTDYKQFKVENDTVTYKLKKIIDHTEVNLKDIVEKLPGLTIGDNKKIKFLGKEIEKVTIEGSDFFGKKHEMATENLSADAIKGIRILKNYKDFTDISSQKTGKIVLNITLKKNYKNRIVGNLDGKSGLLEKYQAHSNLFKFINKGNIALVSEANNIGQSAIDMLDYIEMSGGIRQFSKSNRNDGSGVLEIDHSKTPSFVYVRDDIDSRTTLFNSINFTNTFSKKTKLTGYINVDKTKIKGLTSNTKTFVGVNQSQIIENNTQKSISYLGNSYVTFSYKRNKDEVISYNIKFNPLSDSENKQINQLFKLEKTKKNKLLFLGQHLSYKKNISKYFNTDVNLYSDIRSQKNTLNYKANQNILGTNESNISINESAKINVLDIDISNFMDLSYDTKLKSVISYERSSNNSTLISNFKNFDFECNNRNNEFTFYNKISYIFNYKLSSELGINYINNNLKVNSLKKSQNWILPEILLSYKLGKNNSLHFNFLKSNKNCSRYQTNQKQQVFNYNTIINPNTDIFTPIENTIIGLNYSSYSYNTNSMLSVLTNYTKTKNNIAYDTEIQGNYFEQDYIRTPSETFSSSINYNSVIKRLKLKYNFSGSYFSTKMKTYFLGIENLNTMTSYSTRLILNTTKKQKIIKTRLNIYFDKNSSKNQFSELDYEMISFYLIPEIYGKINAILWRLNYKYKQIKSDKHNQEIQALNFSLQWQFNKKIELFLKGDNVFNLKDNPLISYSSTNSYTQFSKLEQLEGNILVGMRYHF